MGYDISMRTRDILDIALTWDRPECYCWPREFAGKRPLISPGYIPGYSGRSCLNVHRAVYMIYHQCPDIPSSSLILHTCNGGDNGCISINHLYKGDEYNNRSDWIKDGAIQGRLDDADRACIRKYNDGTYQWRKHAAKVFKISVSTIDTVIRNGEP